MFVSFGLSSVFSVRSYQKGELHTRKSSVVVVAEETPS
jgi:hypothetical protein